MTNIPECLQPAVDQLDSYQTKISALEDKNKNLDEKIETLVNEKSALNEQIAQDEQSHKSALEILEQEKVTLRELNVVVSDQLRDKSQQINTLNESNSELNEQNNRVSSESIRASAGQEALSHQTQRLNDEIEKLRQDNDALKQENANLALVSSTSSQVNLDDSDAVNKELISEIDRLKQALLSKSAQSTDNTGDSDSSFLESENQRLVQRHGEITQEKMQASAKMHAAQKELSETSVQLETARKGIKELEFEFQGLQNLHKNLTEEKNILTNDYEQMRKDKSDLDDTVLSLNEEIEHVVREKNSIMQSLKEEHIKSDSLAEEINHLRSKSRRLSEEIKELRDGPQDKLESGVPVLEIEHATDEDTSLNVEIVSSTTSSGPHFPGEDRIKED